ncbi:LemA family protein [Nocardioides ferulae]|uniref:LemA family protein n=1 Tax=Nocardioides ferulae TaxID=2340821 RepID=UPI000EB5083D|nr:LemA family protein [Nocardioides ferulae]
MIELLTLLLLLLGVATLVLLLSLVVMYNRFVRQRTLVDEAWGGIDVELTRRHELVPNLVETVKGYAAHERTLLEALVRARESAAAHQADRPMRRQAYEDALGGTLAQLLVRAEAYPQLKADQHFAMLQKELTLTEDRIAAARRFYNGNVRAYNTRLGTFPSNLVGSAFGFTGRDFFELRDPAARAVPGVGGLPGGGPPPLA